MLIHASRRALASIAIAMLTFLIFILVWTDSFWFSCGTFGLDCVGYAASTLVVGCGIGLFVAMASFVEPDTQPGLKWTGLVLNGLPMCAGAAFWIWISS